MNVARVPILWALAHQLAGIGWAQHRLGICRTSETEEVVAAAIQAPLGSPEFEYQRCCEVMMPELNVAIATMALLDQLGCRQGD